MAGSKTPTHLTVALERYAQLLVELLEKCGGTGDAQKVWGGKGGGGHVG